MERGAKVKRGDRREGKLRQEEKEEGEREREREREREKGRRKEFFRTKRLVSHLSTIHEPTNLRIQLARNFSVNKKRYVRILFRPVLRARRRMSWLLYEGLL